MKEDSATNNPSSDDTDRGGALSPAAAGPSVEERRSGERRSLEEDRIAAALRGFGLVGIVAMLIILFGNVLFVPLSGILILIWAWISKTPWRDLGLAWPRSWVSAVAFGCVFGVAFKLAMKSIVMPLLGAPPVNQAFHFFAHNRGAIPWMLYVIVSAGVGEELVFRGWAFERLGKLIGTAPWAKAVTVLFTSAWFGYEHWAFQGLAGVQQAATVGLIFGTIFAIWRPLFFLMVAHTAFDLAAAALIYWDWETTVAHFFFK
ncbi:MAG: type II CAAX endopeptidase family protein [Chthoniobacterales bacterium]